MNAGRSTLASLRSSETAVLAILCLGVFSTALDQTVVVAALPSVMVDLEIPLTDLDRASWIVVGYLVSYTVAMPLAGRLSDVYGRVRMFQAALVVFSIGSGLVAVAPDFSWIVSARVIQAAGGGATVSNFALFPSEEAEAAPRYVVQAYTLDFERESCTVDGGCEDELRHCAVYTWAELAALDWTAPITANASPGLQFEEVPLDVCP